MLEDFDVKLVDGYMLTGVGMAPLQCWERIKKVLEGDSKNSGKSAPALRGEQQTKCLMPTNCCECPVRTGCACRTSSVPCHGRLFRHYAHLS